MRLFRLLQLADSGFPTGAFAHSAGLEAAVAQGRVDDVVSAVDDLVVQAGRAAWPFARGVLDDPSRFDELDRRVDAFLVGHVTRRASRLQGRAWLDTVCRVFDEAATLREGLGHAPLLHHAPVLGLVAATLGLGHDELSALVLHGALRGALSALVRLSRVGPLEAQSIAARVIERLPAREASLRDLRPEDAVQTSPFVDVLANTHDRLYSRLFLS